MSVDFEKNDGNSEELEAAEFERKLQAAMRRQAAPLGLKTRVLAEARRRRQAQGRRWFGWLPTPMLQRMAASVVIAGAVGGFAVYHQMEERAEQRRGEEAKAQVMAAFRITNKALDRVQERLADDSR
jgi:hypothetical protein